MEKEQANELLLYSALPLGTFLLVFLKLTQPTHYEVGTSITSILETHPTEEDRLVWVYFLIKKTSLSPAHIYCSALSDGLKVGIAFIT